MADTGFHFFCASGVDKIVDDRGKAVIRPTSSLLGEDSGSNRRGSNCTVRLGGKSPDRTPCSNRSYGDSISTLVQ